MKTQKPNMRRELSIRNQALHDRVNDDVKKYDILYFGAPMGWGKYNFFSEFYEKYTGKDTVCWVEPDAKGELEKQLSQLPDTVGRIIMVPRLEQIIEQEEWSLLWNLILHKNKKDRFMLASTTPMPEEMSSFSVFYRTMIYGYNDLRSSNEEVKQYFAQKDIILYEEDILRIEKDFWNMPLCMYLLENPLQNSARGYCRAVKEQCMQDAFTYLDVFLFKTFPVEEQNALLQLFCIDKLDEKIVGFLLNLSPMEARGFLQKLLKKGSILENTSDGLKFEALFGNFLLWAARRYMERKERRELYQKMMIYAEQNEQWDEALRLAYVQKSAENIPRYLSQVLQGRLDNSRLLELEKYLLEIPEKTVLEYPDLIMMKVFLEAFKGNRKKAWEYIELFQRKTDRETDPERKKFFQERIIYLKFLFPGGIETSEYRGLLTKIKELINRGEWKYQSSVGSSQLSILHGDQDFCSLILEKINIPQAMDRFVMMLDDILVNSTQGMANYLLAEILYEYNRLDQALNHLSKGYRDTEKTPRIRQLCSVKIMDILIAKNQMDSTDSFLPYHMEGEKDGLFEDNFAAHQVNSHLLRNNTEKIQAWMKERAPDENGRFYGIHQYQYLIKAKVYILQEQYVLAMMILETLLDYAKSYRLCYLEMQVRILEAVIYYREKSQSWSEVLWSAAEMAEKLGFVRVFADEGAAVYEPLQKLSSVYKKLQKSEWYKQTLAAVRVQMLQYPEYLAEKRQLNMENFSDSERDIMRLLVRGEKNAEIAKHLFISENTVKYHLKNIYQKLDVGNRSQAASRIMDLHIL